MKIELRKRKTGAGEDVIITIPGKEYKPVRRVGICYRDKRLFVTRRNDLQWFRQVGGFGISLLICQMLAQKKYWITVIYRHSGREAKRTVLALKWLQEGTIRQLGADLEEQVFLSLEEFGVRNSLKWLNDIGLIEWADGKKEKPAQNPSAWSYIR